ncbi:MAG: ATP-dependent protease [Planctomycetia bacterium]|nr:ATP-dependent protease [Planctomycetia bacterium]
MPNGPIVDFSGTVRLFPLPNLVLFPHVGQPLHIFEPRYRQLMADAVDDDRLIGIALLRPGWEEDYHKKPPIHDTVCVGRIINEEKLSDGRYNLILQGVCRGRIREEIKTGKMYRTARVDLMPDQPIASNHTERELRRELGQSVSPFFSANPSAAEQFQQLLEAKLPLGAMTDIFSFALPLEVEQRQQLLEEACVDTRIRLLLSMLDKKTPPVLPTPRQRKFPPEFSAN